LADVETALVSCLLSGGLVCEAGCIESKVFVGELGLSFHGPLLPVVAVTTVVDFGDVGTCMESGTFALCGGFSGRHGGGLLRGNSPWEMGGAFTGGCIDNNGTGPDN
jgi:hypothetical protein